MTAAQPRIQLPANGWRPRAYQRPAWKYLERGGRHAELIWHRRAGKDELCLAWGGVAAHQRPATYWHMLPQASQARKAIWEAINPHSGKRRIDEAFPHELRETTRENEMLIKFKIGSTWQVVGSDNFNSLVGSPPAGITVSEWALANPAARAYLRPILAENKGWQLYITTPRGRNHAHKTYEAAKRDPDAFAQRLTIHDTGAMTPAEIDHERQAYRDDFGSDQGDALFSQEYECSFDAPNLGAYYAGELRRMEDAGRVVSALYDPSLVVNTAWDLGYRDDTSIWFYQVHRNEIRLIDYYSVSGADIPDIAMTLHGKPYRYGDHWMPHDAAPETLASGGRSILEQFWALGIKGKIVPRLSVQDGIQAVRMMLPLCWFDIDTAADGLDCLRSYHREWDDDHKCFRDKPVHDWSSHGADAFRMLAVGWRVEAKDAPPPKPRFLAEMTVDELWRNSPANRQRRI